MQRATFLRTSAGAMSLLALAPLSAQALASEVISVTLRSGPFRFTPAAGMAFDQLAYNGMLPGPLLRVMHGQRIRARYVNGSGLPSTIHWHGMILPNAMDGVEGITQPAIPPGGEFLYEFAPNPIGTRWYHDHVGLHLARGLFGMFIVEDPHDDPADAQFALAFHDVPSRRSLMAAMAGTSDAAMVDPMDSPEMRSMQPGDKMGDEVAYLAHCINGAAYPSTKPIAVKVGQRVRLRILNANPTQTKYIRLAGHSLLVTHSDGNKLEVAREVDILRIGVAERYDAWFEVKQPGAWLLQVLSSEPTAYQQAVVVHTPGMEHAPPQGSSMMLADAKVLSYDELGGITGVAPPLQADITQAYHLGGGRYGSSRWTMNGETWPNVQRIIVRSGQGVIVRFHNTTDMDHPMHLHGHVFEVMEVDGKRLAHPLPKDTSLVRSNGGTMTWRFVADSPPGRWLLHCHNAIHMMDGMATEVDYRA